MKEKVKEKKKREKEQMEREQRTRYERKIKREKINPLTKMEMEDEMEGREGWKEWDKREER